MNLINSVISRIEKGNTLRLGFHFDNESPRGSLANVSGLVWFKNKWYVEVEFHDFLGSPDVLDLVQYMEQTSDVVDM